MSLRSTLLTPGIPVVFGWLFVAQIFTVFFTGVKLIPGIKNNFGPFEIFGGVLILLVLLSPAGRPNRMRGHPIVTILFCMATMAGLSLTWFQGPTLRMGVVQTLILVFQFAFVLVSFNLMLRYQISPEKLLRLVTYSALIIGPWILIAGLDTGESIQGAGPFRNRSHMANYMLTAFWLVLLHNSWPGLRRGERLISYAALASTLYPIAISGRRSVYLSLIFGLLGIGLSFLAAARGRRRAAFFAAVTVFGFLGLMYVVGPSWLPRLEFFQSRVLDIDNRLEMAIGDSGADASDNFFEAQRAGVRSAVADYPIGGIGWGAFHNSAYSLTGHEVHSMPLRFLAELGLVGLGLYTAMIAVLLFGSVRLIFLLRNSVYRTPAVILTVALWSLTVSFAYNRHITERTFWLLLVFYLTFEAFARTRSHFARQARQPPVPRAQAWRPRQAAAVLARPR